MCVEQGEQQDGMTKLAFYDMDRTITRSGTYTPFLMHMVRARASWRIVLAIFIPFAFIAYATRLLSRSGLKTFNQRLLLGARPSLAALKPYIESYADAVMADNVYASALDRVASDKAEGYTLILATASYHLYVDAIAARLGFDHVIATRLKVNDEGQVRAHIIGDNCYDKAKLTRIEAWMSEHVAEDEQTDIRAYSDHISDMPMLEFADEAYATNPHPPLRAEAARKGWKIFDW